MDPAVTTQVCGRCDRARALGADQHAFHRADQTHHVAHLVVRYRERDARALAQGAKDQEVTERLWHAETRGEGLGFCPWLRFARARLERAHDRGATGGLGGYEARHVVAGDPSDLTELHEALPHADETDAATGRIHDDVGQLPLKLFGELEA